MTTFAQRACTIYGNLSKCWTRRRLRFDVHVNPKKSSLEMEPDEFVSFVPMEAIGEYGSLGLEDVRELTDVYDGYTYFADGDVIIAKITPCFENGKGALAGGLTNGVGFGTTELHVVRPGPKIDRHFLFYVSIAHDFRQLGESKMRGAAGQKRIDESFIKDWMAPLPSLDIQRRIVRFLDEMTTRVDELIEKKRELLDLLAEKRQALITLTVTKDLNPDPGDTTKVSDKLSEVYQGLPSGWSIKRLKYLATYNDDVLPENTDEDMEIDYVEISGVSLSSGIDKIKRMPLGKAPTRARRMVCDGDILISTVRTYLRAITNVDAASPDLIASTGFCVVRPREGVDSSFLGWAAKSEPFVSEVVSRSAGVSYPAINASELVTISIPCPPLNVQRQIAGFLAEKTGQIDAVTNQIRRSMEYLREYRSALITATVTGQLGDTL